MLLAPRSPQDKRRGLLARSLQALGLSGLALLLTVAALGAFLAQQFFFATPEQLYHRTWQAVPHLLYDPSKLADWKQWEHKYDGKIHTDEDAVRFANEMLASLDDPYTHLHGVDEVAQLNREAEGQFAGIGIRLGLKSDGSGRPVKSQDGKPLPETDQGGYPVIDSVISGGPAEKAGLTGGTALVSADGKDLKGLSVEAVIASLKGDVGKPLELVVRKGGVDSKVTLVRAVINMPSVEARYLGSDPQAKIGYIRMESFEQNDLIDEMAAALAQLKDAHALVLDLRNNPGGRVDLCIRAASMFIPSGDIVTIRSRVPLSGYVRTTYHVDASGMTLSEVNEVRKTTSVDHQERQALVSGDIPIIILVNGHSASAAEMFTGALKDNGRAMVVGERSFGKGIGQSLIPMPNGTLLRITSLHYFTPSGAWLGDGHSDKHGIEPNFTVKPAADFRAGGDRDNQLEFAVQQLKKQLDASR